MKRAGLLNPALSSAVARLGHTDTFVVADCGLPIPASVPVVDLTVVFGLPSFADVLAALLAEVVVEGAVAASEAQAGPAAGLLDALPVTPAWVPHSDFKALVSSAAFVVRTGECTPYANVILRCGVPF